MLLPTALYGIIGWPLGQTLSPLIHNVAFETLDLPAVYFAWPLEPPRVGEFITAMDMLKINGLSVTIPHKMAVMPYVENLSEAAALAGAVNTLYWRDSVLCGDNTDVTGFLSPLSGLQLDHMDILILGAGGAAHAAAAALRMSGATNARVTSPGNRRQYPLAERFGFTPIKWENRYDSPATLVVNATPLGMYGQFVNQTPYDFKKVPPLPHSYAYDLVYNPQETLFLREAQEAGRQPIYGLEMFWGQGNAQFNLWTGKNLPQESRIALLQALGGEK